MAEVQRVLIVTLAFVGPAVASWVIARSVRSRWSIEVTTFWSILLPTILWATVESYIIVSDVVANGTDPVAGVVLLGLPTVQALCAIPGALIGLGPARSRIPNPRLALTLAGVTIVAALVSTAAAYVLFGRVLDAA